MSFDYNSGSIEVFMVSNDDGTVNGYAEVTAVAQLLSPYNRVSVSQLWNNTHATYKIQNGGKNYIHAIAICKFISTIPESESESYKSLRQLVRDLIVGNQIIENKSKEEIKVVLEKTNLELSELRDELKENLKKLFEQNSNTLSDFNGLLRVLKTELIGELNINNKDKDVDVPVADLLTESDL